MMDEIINIPLKTQRVQYLYLISSYQILMYSSHLPKITGCIFVKINIGLTFVVA